MKFLILLLLTFPFLSFAIDDVEVIVEPKEAIINESFFVTFKVKVSGNEEPYISFTPYGASVLGKRSQGLSISTTVINGKISTSKEQAIVYELLAERSGQAYLRNIKMELGDKTIPIKEVRINVLNEARRVADAFLEAEASKTRVYLGEGFDVNYYLYYKVPISANDIKEFPKLNKFIKRFHHINAPVETVQYKGQVLKRLLIYSARVYPEKVGAAVLDPMKISVQIYENDYSGFGFGSQRYKNKDISSPRVEMEVLPLPSEGVPSSFTGLVGEHDFSLSISKTKYLVNEPIEIKLEVKGKGAVENFDAPVIYTDNNLEQFDTKSEVKELDSQSAKKLFEYTLLARGPVNIPARDLLLAYFDPSSGRYIEKKVSIPSLEVSGVGPVSDETGTTIKNESPQSVSSQDDQGLLNSFFKPAKNIQKNQIGLVAPSLKGQERWFDKGLLVLNGLLTLGLIGILGQWYYVSQKQNVPASQYSLIKTDIRHMKKKGLSYPELFRILSALDKTNKMATGGVSIINVINESNLNDASKEYFKNALSYTEGGAYAQSKRNSDKGIQFEKKHFNELLKNI